LRRW